MPELQSGEILTFSTDHKFLGLDFGARMSAICLKDKSLLVYSPVPLSEVITASLNKTGTVKYILAPNLFHHLYAGDAKKAFPNARLYTPPGLAGKRKDLAIDEFLEAGKTYPWSSEVETIPMEGMNMMQEVSLFHKASKTMICCDLVTNFKNPQGAWTRFYLKYIAGDILDRPGISRIVKLTFNDRKKAAKSIQKLIDLQPERIVMAHGEILDTNATETLKQIFNWLI